MPAIRVARIISPGVAPGIPRHEREVALTTNGLIQIMNHDSTPLIRMDSIQTRVTFDGLTVPQVAHQISMQRL